MGNSADAGISSAGFQSQDTQSAGDHHSLRLVVGSGDPFEYLQPEKVYIYFQILRYYSGIILYISKRLLLGSLLRILWNILWIAQIQEANVTC